MAGRIRTLKPEILENERTARLTHEAWRLFVSLLLLSDDWGNLHANPARLAGSIFWGKECSRSTEELLCELESSGLILRYGAKGQPCLHISGWEEHQRVDKPGRPRVLGPDKADVVSAPERQLTLTPLSLDPVEPAADSRESRETLGTDLISGSPDHDHDPDHDHLPISASPSSAPPHEQESLALQQPESVPKRPKVDPAAVQAVLSEFSRLWVESRQPADGKPPALVDKDRFQVVKLVRDHGADGALDLVRQYLDDSDRWLSEQGHPLRLITSRVNGYRARNGPKKRFGFQEPCAPFTETREERL